jgi:hypothetical protein
VRRHPASDDVDWSGGGQAGDTAGAGSLAPAVDGVTNDAANLVPGDESVT